MLTEADLTPAQLRRDHRGVSGRAWVLTVGGCAFLALLLAAAAIVVSGRQGRAITELERVNQTTEAKCEAYCDDLDGRLLGVLYRKGRALGCVCGSSTRGVYPIVQGGATEE